VGHCYRAHDQREHARHYARQLRSRIGYQCGVTTMRSRPGGLGSIGEAARDRLASNLALMERYRCYRHERPHHAPTPMPSVTGEGRGSAAKTAPGGLSVRLFTTAARSFRRVYHRSFVKSAPRRAELSSRSFYTTPEFFQRMESVIYERR